MLALRPPFEGATVVELLQEVILRDPPPPRRFNPSLDRDLETICLKCLEKDPDRRYAGASGLAEDLRRFLEGRPIQARPPSLSYRVLKALRFHRALSVLSAVFLLVLLGVGVAAYSGLMFERGETAKESDRAERAEESAEEARMKSDEAKRLRAKNAAVSSVLLAAYSRLGNVYSELRRNAELTWETVEEKRRLYRGFEKRIESFLASAGGVDPKDTEAYRSARATSTAVKAWLLRLGGFGPEAFAHFEESRKTDPEVAWGYLFEAMAHLSRYLSHRKLPRIEIGLGTLRLMDPQDENDEERARALERFMGLLAQVGENVEGSSPPRKKASCFGGEESGILEILLSSLRDLEKEDLERAEQGLSDSLDHWATAWLEEELLLARASIRYRREDFDGALDDVRTLISKEYSGSSYHLFLGDLYRARGLHKRFNRLDGVGDLEEAVAAYKEAGRRSPGRVSPLEKLGFSYVILGETRKERGDDPSKSFIKAADIFLRIQDMDAGYLPARVNRSIALARLAESQAQAGKDPRPLFREALAEMDEILRQAPDRAGSRMNRGILLGMLADAAGARGEDPRPLYRKAV
jgi:tetratricopeptide (TPR) repeat protein